MKCCSPRQVFVKEKKKRKKEKQQNREEKPVPTVMEIKKLTGEVRTKIIYTIIFQILKPLCFINFHPRRNNGYC